MRDFLMKKQFFQNIMIRTMVASLLLLQGCSKNITKQSVVLREDAEDGVASNMIAKHRDGYYVGKLVRPFGGSNVIGNFNNTRLTIELDTLPPHNMIAVSFDLYIHDNWEGNNIGQWGIVDAWNINVDDWLQFSTNFSNNPAYSQAFPNWTGIGGSMPAKGNAVDTTLTGICLFDRSANHTSKYRISFNRPHTRNGVRIDLSDAAQDYICNRSWSIDNVIVKVITN
jgi:hypothetical protein